MLSVVYAVLLTLGNLDNLTPQGQWRVLAAPWLGEPPAGLQVETIRAGNFGDCPATVFSLPANEELRRRIIETYRLDPAGTTAAGEEKFGNKHVLPDYTDDTRPVLPGLSVCISPWLVVNSHPSCVSKRDFIHATGMYFMHCDSSAFIPLRAAVFTYLR